MYWAYNQTSLSTSQLADTFERPEIVLGEPKGLESCDPLLLAGDAECHQLYKSPVSTTGGLLLLVVVQET